MRKKFSKWNEFLDFEGNQKIEDLKDLELAHVDPGILRER